MKNAGKIAETCNKGKVISDPAVEPCLIGTLGSNSPQSGSLIRSRFSTSSAPATTTESSPSKTTTVIRIAIRIVIRAVVTIITTVVIWIWVVIGVVVVSGVIIWPRIGLPLRLIIIPFPRRKITTLGGSSYPILNKSDPTDRTGGGKVIFPCTESFAINRLISDKVCWSPQRDDFFLRHGMFNI